MATRGYIAMTDYSSEKTGTGFYVQDVLNTGLNYGSVSQDVDEMKDAILAITGCVVNGAEVSVFYPESSATPTNLEGNREGKWLVRMKDTTQYKGAANSNPNVMYGKIFTFTVPGALLTTASGPTRLVNTDDADLVDNTEMIAFRDACEANVRSPWNHDTTGVTPTQEVVSITYVGRNN